MFNNITEIMPDNIPEWAQKAMENGTFFATCLKRPISFQHARSVMREEFKKSEDLKYAFESNISMCIYDNRRKDGRLNVKECRVVAEKLITLIWGGNEKGNV